MHDHCGRICSSPILVAAFAVSILAGPAYAQGKAPDDLPYVEAAPAPGRPASRDVFVYIIHEGKIRAPAAAMALIERLKKANSE